MQEEIVIRKAQPTDIAQILRHRRSLYESLGERQEQTLDAMQASTSVFLEHAIPAGIFRGWLAETSARRVVGGGGMMIVPWLGRPADPEPRRAWILNVYAEPEYRRRGIARRLMQTMIEWCREAGFQSVSLHSSEEGRPLYQSLGFKPTDEMKLVLRAT
jgi:GNAT superfamily N-acetyltransferase